MIEINIKIDGHSVTAFWQRYRRNQILWVSLASIAVAWLCSNVGYFSEEQAAWAFLGFGSIWVAYGTFWVIRHGPRWFRAATIYTLGAIIASVVVAVIAALMGHRHPEYLFAKGIGLSILWAIVIGVVAFKRRYLPLIPADEPEDKSRPQMREASSREPFGRL